MHHYSTNDAEMNKENIMAAESEQSNVRVTRARAKGLGTSGDLPQKTFAMQDKKKVVQPNLKRVVPDEKKTTARATACPQRKKRAVLEDVTNICHNSDVKCINGRKVQSSKQAKSGIVKRNTKVAPEVLINLEVQKETKAKITEDTAKERTQESHKISSLSVDFEETLKTQPTSTQGCEVPDQMLVKKTSSTCAQLGSPSKKDKGQPCKKVEVLDGLSVPDIDSYQKDPQMCGMYAPDIYINLLATELDRRPSVDYMEMLQRDITHVMRGILIDWLVEVSDEYRLVPDTLFMTVNLIDRFLSKNYIEKQRLQLLGITCMLIASKYEEICAPRVEEFCFITDNTYKREEVLQMESQVLNFLGFQLSVPTTKKFLRRYIQAAQSSYKVPCVELEFLANYLAELTLTEYSFLKFLPSLIAASAVFLARWALDQSNHPWNPTLEHYTSYKVSRLKPTVLGLQELLHNTNGSSLNAIREKYRQQKFKCVATLSALKPVQSLF